MADSNVKRVITIVGASQGLDKLAADVDKVTAAQTRATQAEKSVAVVRDESSRATAGITAKSEAYVRQNDALAKAMAQVERGERLLRETRMHGLPTADAVAKALDNARNKVAELAKEHARHTEALSLNRNQMMELTHVGKSMFDMLAAGQSPLRALQVEAGRIGQIFAEGQGGVGGTLKAMGGQLARLATGWVGLGVGIAAGLGAAGVAVMRFQSQQDALARSLNGVGRAAGVDLAGLTAIANAGGSRNPALGNGGATSLAATLASTGRINGSLMPGIMDMVTPYARGTGQDLTEAGKELAKAFSDPAKGAETLNEKLGFLDATTKEHIESLMRQGNLLGAQQTLLAKAADEAARMADRTWSMTRAWEAFTSAVGNGADAFAGGLQKAFAPTLADRLATLENDHDPRRRALRGELPALRLGVAYQRYGDSRLQGGAAADKASNDLSIVVADALRRALPDEGRVRQLNDTLKLLDSALKNPDVLAKVPGGRFAVQSARDVTQNQLTYNDPMRRIEDDARLAVASAQARTLAERLRIESERAYIEVLREGKTEALAAAAAEAKRKEMLAQAAREVFEFNRDAARSLTYARMSPYEAGRQRIIDEHRDFVERSGTGGAVTPGGAGAAVSPKPKANPFGDLWDAAAAFAKDTSWATKPLPAAAEPHAAVAAARGRVAATASGSSAQGLRDRLAAYDFDAIQRPFRRANQELDAQQALTKIQSSGAAGSALEGMIARQRMLNELNMQGVKITSAVTASLDAYQVHATATARAQEQLAQAIQDADAIRSGARDSLHTFVNDLIAGKNATVAFRDAMEQLGRKLLDTGMDRFTDMLLGKSGTLLGGTGGGSGGGAGGLIGGLLGGLFKFADGGVMTSAGPMPLRRYAGGGIADSPQVALYGERGPEAFVPLPDGRRIPVAMQGGGKGHTYNIGGPVLNVQGSIEAATMPEVRAMFAEGMKRQMQEFQRNAGTMQARWQARYAG